MWKSGAGESGVDTQYDVVDFFNMLAYYYFHKQTIHQKGGVILGTPYTVWPHFNAS